MRRAAKIDQNQNEIVNALRKAGCKVLSLAACGKGVPDLIVCVPHQHDHDFLCFLEVKNLAGRGNKLTEDQVKFHNEWPVKVVTSVEEALAELGIKP